MTQLGIWNFHAADDGTMNVSESQMMIYFVRRVGGSTINTEYATIGHVIWTPAYHTVGATTWAARRGKAEIRSTKFETNPNRGK